MKTGIPYREAIFCSILLNRELGMLNIIQMRVFILQSGPILLEEWAPG